MNILEVYYEPRMSGITRHVGQFVPELEGEDLKFHVLCSTDDRRIPSFYRSHGIPVKRVPGAKYFSFRGMLELIRLVKKWRIDVVHIHNLQSVFWSSLPKILLPRTVFLFTPHIIVFENKTIERVFYLVWRFFSILTREIIALSKEQKTRLVKLGIKRRDRIRTIYNTVPGNKAGKRTEEKSPFPSDAFCILSLIRLVRQKNPEQIIHIAEQVCESHPNARFFIAGEGPLKRLLRRIIACHELTDRVILLGYRPDALELIREADLLLSTSLWEGLPYTILEAMSMGCPVVASDIEGHRPLVVNGETGFLAGTTEEFVQKIILLIGDENMKREMGKKAGKRFERYFSFSRFLESMKNLYLSFR